MKVVAAHYNLRIIFFHTFHIISPAAAEFQCSFHSFHSCIHWQKFIVTKKFGHVFFILPKQIIVKRTAGERKFLRLLNQCIDDSRMTMSLIHRGVSRKKIEILFPFSIPHMHTASTLQHYRKRMIVMSTIFFFEFYERNFCFKHS